MTIEKTDIRDLFLIHFDTISDERGSFFRTYSSKELNNHGLKAEFIQHNHVINPNSGTWRGLHFQKEPFSEIKYVRCIKGKALDFVVDLRKNSESFLKYLSFELSPQNMNALWIPKGIAHGYLTLEDNTEMLYLHTEEYNKGAEDGIKYDDPILKLKLPISISKISTRDQSFQYINDQFKGI